MQFIEAILSSPFLLFIVIMAISSLFKSDPKKRQQQEERTKPTAPTQTQTQTRTQTQTQTSQRDVPKRETIFEQLKREMERQLQTDFPETESTRPIGRPNAPLPETERVVQSKPVINEVKEYNRKRESSRQVDLEAEMAALQFSLAEKKQRNKALKVGALKLTREKVVEGIIMSEILGPPRARRPFQQNRYK